MNANEIIKELLTRLYLSSIRSPASDLWTSPLTESYATNYSPGTEDLEASLGGEAKVLWDMVNESPYTPLETELLQRLDIVHYVHHKAEAGDFVDNYLAMALHAPTETVKGFEAVLPYAESGLPWSETWIWEQYKDSF